jgi:hypothetical protein
MFLQQIKIGMARFKDGKQVGLLFAKNGIPMVTVRIAIIVVHHRRVCSANKLLAGWMASSISSKSRNGVGIERSLVDQSIDNYSVTA